MLQLLIPRYLARNGLAVAVIALATCVGRWAAGESDFESAAIDFQRDVAPILSDACLKCHGETNPQGQLRLDVGQAAFVGGFSGAGVVPGDPNKSEVYQRVTSADPDLRMPYKQPPLSQKQVSTIRRWIEQGAKWPKKAGDAIGVRTHWAYVRPVRPALPEVQDAAWIRNPIDSFVLSRIEQRGFHPAPEASKEQLIRRLSLDLTGLPPTPDQINDFLEDHHPNAYDRVVDRLLNSPHYGERWAQPWLDAARYSDSNGFTNDRPRSIWPYRDWVIKAYNDDMPFDEFTIEQIAGDLLPNATDSQRVATGFHRNTMFNDEQGVDQYEARWHAMVDRVGTTATVWLGTTLACAQCHNHKYDPFSQRDFYRLLAFFENVDFTWEGNAYNRRYIEPVLDLSPPDARDKRLALEQEIVDLQEELRKSEVDGKRSSSDLSTNIHKKLDDARRRLTTESASYPRSLVMRDRPSEEPLSTNIRVKGSFLSKGEVVEAGVPSALPALHLGEAHSRLALARWLVAPENPLTARVIVNRYWSQFFGRGIVETEEDFGTRGALPSHPELLDWLASDFVRLRWSSKQLHRLIVTSATYRQSSIIRAESLEEDPDNRLLSRGPRVRLNAEFVRDVSLAASGLLSEKMGGPGVFPPQPAISPLQDHGDFVWAESKGEDRYRRGIYTFWRRTALYPALQVFDAPSRDACTVRRTRSNTPMQALTMLNDATAAECATSLAKRILKESGDGRLRDRVTLGYRLCTGRLPTDDELEICEKHFQRCKVITESDPTSAKTIAQEAAVSSESAEFAAWFLMSQSFLNLDETLTKE